MAAPAAVLSILVNVNTAQATAGLTRMNGQLVATDQAAGKSSKSVGRFGTLAKAGGIAAAAGIGVAVVAIKSSVKAAQEAEVSQTKMRTQLKALGISYRAHAGQIDEVIQKHSRLSGLDDEDLQDSFTNIVRVTGNVSEALRLNGLAADFARAKHIGVAKAGEIIAKVAGGNVGILSRYGLSMDKGATSTEALGILQQKFAGQAEAYGKTTAGAQDRFKVATENLQEALGKGLLPIVTKVANALADAMAWLEKNRGVAIALGVGVGVLATALIAAAAAQALMNLAVLANPYVAAVALVVALGVAIYVFRDKITSVFNWLKDHWPEIAVIIAGPFAPLVALATNGFGIRDKFISALNSMKNTASDVIGGIISVFAGIPGKLLDLVEAAASAIGKFTRPIIDAFHDVKDIIVKVWSWISKVIEGVKDAVGWIGKIKIPHVDLNPFGGSGGGNVGPGVKLGGSGVDQFNSVASKFGNVVTSGYRPGDDGYHGMNRARDYAGGNMLAFAKYMVGAYGSKLTELIHTPLGFGIKNGQMVGLGFWGSAVNADHFDHVHVALAKGGIVTKPTRALIGEDGPEAVIPLSGRNAFGGGSEYHFHFDNYVGDKEELMRVVASEMNRTIARQGYVLRPQTN